jgi:crotonobetainyl-CoA:carnitine CoA-transferase CaiB-like acyl-CoA transferase
MEDQRIRTQQSLPLDGIRVVALEQAVAGPLCSRHLADLGADVVKIERPDGGDFARRYDTAVKGLAAHWVWLNRGKRSVALDVKRSEDREVLEALLARADVFVHNLGPGAVDRLGYGWTALQNRWPRLISCAISGYGMEGPYRDRKAFDLLLQGESGVIAVTGSPEAPAKVGISIGDISAALYALSSILAALYERQRTGVGRVIDVAMLDCLAEWMAPPLYYQIYDGVQPERAGMRHATIVPYGPYRTGDGTSVNLAVQNEGQWVRLCQQVLGRPEWVEDPRFCSNVLRTQNRAVLEPLIEEALQAHTRASAQEALEAADVPYGALNDVADVVAHPQFAARGRWYDVESEAGIVRALAHPLNIMGMRQRMDPVPALGEHNEEIKRELGLA